MTSFTYKTLKINTHPEVYDPAEDSFQLLENIQIKKGQKIFEIGTGTGLIALSCTKKGADVVCSDINPFAIDLVAQNYQENKNKLIGTFEIRLGDLFSVLENDELFDIIIFNPPYLPTKPDELIGGTGWIDKATSGGTSGLELTINFIRGLHPYLAENGSAYFIYSSLSDRKELENCINKSNFDYSIISSITYGDETLDVYKIKKKKR